MKNLFDIKYPIIQAPTGTIARERLAIAVSKAGGLGSMGLTWDTPEDATHRVHLAKAALGNLPFLVNYVLHFEPTSIEAVIKAGAPIIQFSYGLPHTHILNLIKKYKTKFGIQVVDKSSAVEALKLNPDFLICQGLEAGGHVQAIYPLKRALSDVLAVANKTPVFASGGIGNGHDIRTIMNQGAAGAVLGSRFVASDESSAHPKYKNAIVESSSEDTIYTVCFSDGWENAPHRVIKNKTFDMWIKSGAQLKGNRMNEMDVIATHKTNNKDIYRYAVSAPHEEFEGDVLELAMYAGESISSIKDISSAEKIMDTLWEEFLKKI